MEFCLRDYRPADLNAIYRLDMECFEPVFRFSRRAMQRFAEASEAVTVVAEVESAVVGFAIAEVAEGVGYVVTLDVDPHWRGRGLGRSLMAALEQKARTAGAEVLMLHVYEQNRAAIALYERSGYKTTGVSRGFYGRGLHAAAYEKPI